MNFLPVYLDSSAILALVQDEAPRAALETELARWPDRISSALTPVECWRCVRRANAPAQTQARLTALLGGLILIRFDEALLRLATHVGPPLLRSLDAIHLATALSIGDYPEAFITYDDRLAAAARKLKLRVVQPGR
jgi:predicted nucleic acid-binding protein